MVEKSGQLQDAAFFTRRYILSACMNWNDCTYIRADGNKSSNWKKERKSQVRIDPQSWQIVFQHSSDSKSKDDTDNKTEISSVTIEETKETDKPFQYLSVKYAKGDILSIAGTKDFVNLLYCGLMYTQEKFDQISSNPLIVSKTQEIESMLETTKSILAKPLNEATEIKVSDVPNLRFLQPIPQDAA
ncbi:hypothetical protein GPJ56_009923 [Histomonas meleagridis]|uniref:uncharacterized protein n=1 Tax=Histomonas meleagridis TaxID=135588 RepID=UPI003559D6E2|nr:hypothetical protein GPJ56_009923 [Histomonas meleagridis]KAH0802769.1 hypothetical protein GO595_004276 [Histomonas meleagridis]